MSRKTGTNDLLPRTVIDLRERAAAGETDEQLAVAYGILTTRVADVRMGKTYRHIGGPRTRRQGGKPRKPREVIVPGDNVLDVVDVDRGGAQ